MGHTERIIVGGVGACVVGAALLLSGHWWWWLVALGGIAIVAVAIFFKKVESIPGAPVVVPPAPDRPDVPVVVPPAPDRRAELRDRLTRARERFASYQRVQDTARIQKEVPELQASTRELLDAALASPAEAIEFDRRGQLTAGHEGVGAIFMNISEQITWLGFVLERLDRLALKDTWIPD